MTAANQMLERLIPDTTSSTRLRPCARLRPWMTAHAGELRVLLVFALLVVVGVVHAVGMNSDPQTWNSDAGDYTMSAWSVAHLGKLTPYAYTWDHVPGGWIQMAGLAVMFNGFAWNSTAIAFGNEVALLYALATALLLYLVALRLRMGQLGASAVVLVWGLSPLAVEYARPAYLDNLAVPWLLLAFYLATNPGKKLWVSAAGGLAFGVACLTKETSLVVAPALAIAYVLNSDRRNRARVWLMSAAGASIVVLYPWFAFLKGELWPRSGRDTLGSSIWWQLVTRPSTGSIENPGSIIRATLSAWYGYDHYLLIMSLAAIPLAVMVKQLWPVVLAMVIQTAMVAKGGYVPDMQIAEITPWAALVLVGGVRLALWGPWWTWSNVTARWRRAGLLARRAAVVALVAAFAVVVAPRWVAGDETAMSFRGPVPLAQAEAWVANNVPRSSTLVVDPTIWVDLQSNYGFTHVVEESKIDADPTVVRTVRRIDYIVVPNSAFTAPDAVTVYPSLRRALAYSIPVATFGVGPNGVRIWRVGSDFPLRG